jgi:hypothetical protein
VPRLNPNGESAAGADFQAGDDPRRDAGLIARVFTADPMERVY